MGENLEGKVSNSSRKIRLIIFKECWRLKAEVFLEMEETIEVGSFLEGRKGS